MAELLPEVTIRRGVTCCNAVGELRFGRLTLNKCTDFNGNKPQPASQIKHPWGISSSKRESGATRESCLLSAMFPVACHQPGTASGLMVTALHVSETSLTTKKTEKHPPVRFVLISVI